MLDSKFSRTIVMVLALILSVTIFWCCGTLFHNTPEIEELSEKEFYQQTQGLTGESLNQESLQATKEACRLAVESFYGEKVVLEDYISIWFRGGATTVVYYYTTSDRTFYMVPSTGEDLQVANLICDEKATAKPVAEFNGKVLTFSLS